MGSATQWLFFSAADYAFACPMSEVIEIVPKTSLKHDNHAMPKLVGWVDIQGASTPVFNLIELVHHKVESYQYHEIVVLQSQGKLIALAVEKIIAISAPGEENKLEHCISTDKFNLIKNLTYLKDKHLCLNLQ